jgi:hypothetical protein
MAAQQNGKRRTITVEEASRRGLAIAMALVIVGLILAFGVVMTGLLVVQPIGAVPDGVTIWYWRAGLGLRFIESPDGMSLDRVGYVSLMSRAAALSAVTEAVEGRIILRLPYMDWLYGISTDGQRFER